MVSVAKSPDPRKSCATFKGIFCHDISEFDPTCPATQSVSRKCAARQSSCTEWRWTMVIKKRRRDRPGGAKADCARVSANGPPPAPPMRTRCACRIRATCSAPVWTNTLLAIFAARANEWRGEVALSVSSGWVTRTRSSTASVSATRFPLSDGTIGSSWHMASK